MTDDLGPVPEHAVPPSVRAARQAGPRNRQRETGRAYPPHADPHDPTALGAELAATQALFRAESPAAVAAIVATLVHDLGGAVVPARYADPAMAVPVDASLGLSEAMLPVAEPVSVAAMRLGGVLPEFLEAARLMLSRLESEHGREETQDQLSGLLPRRAWVRRLAEATPADSICLLDLDDFTNVDDDVDVEDTGGHVAGDAVLHALGTLMLRTFGKDDSCGRWGWDELVCLAPRTSGPSLVARCEQLREAWEKERRVGGALVGFSIGVAEVGDAGGHAALQSAAAAMYRGKTEGGNRTVLGSTHDIGRGGPA